MNLNEQPREPMDTAKVIPENVAYCLGRNNVWYGRDGVGELVSVHRRYVWEEFYDPPHWDGYDLTDGGNYLDVVTAETIIVQPIMKCWGRGIRLKRGVVLNAKRNQSEDAEQIL